MSQAPRPSFRSVYEEKMKISTKKICLPYFLGKQQQDIVLLRHQYY
jgi:hypothetical protein